MSDAAKRIVTELKVSGQLMTLEPGVFCIFNQGPAARDGSGLPGVRISLPPGAASADAVTISTFRQDGWLGGADSAALIRIRGGPGQVLVTVYQAPNGGEPPKLQVVRLTDVPADPAPVARTPPTPSRPQPKLEEAEVAVHVNRVGDLLAMMGDWAGQPGSQRWIEGFALAPKRSIAPGDIEYQAILGRDWLSPWSEGGQYCGSRGMSLPLLGLRVRLRGAAAHGHDVSLEASFVNGQTVGPVGAGEACETDDLAALEAFRLSIRPRAEAAPSRRAKKQPAPTPAPAKGPAERPGAPKRPGRVPPRGGKPNSPRR